jgi:hypothetical protein
MMPPALARVLDDLDADDQGHDSHIDYDFQSAIMRLYDFNSSI